MMATDKVKSAQAALDKAKSDEVAKIKTTQKKATDKRIANDIAGIKDHAVRTEAINKSLDGDTMDSKLLKVTVSYRQENREDRVKVGAVVQKNGKGVPQRFQVPVNVVVEIPEEVISQIKGRKIEKYVGKELKLVPQFNVEVA